MDPVETVGRAGGLRRIAAALREAGISVDAIYLIKLENDGGHVEWVLRVVTSRNSREVVLTIFELRRKGSIPRFGDKIRIDPIPLAHPEASRIIAYAQRFADLPVEIENVILDRMLIDYALVAELPEADAAAA